MRGRRAVWRRIRTETLRAFGDTCVACCVTSPEGRNLVCDELWSYDEQARIATLVGTRILCRACDAARHFELTGVRGYAAEALATLARVNGIEIQAARSLRRQAMRDFRRRSALRWVVRVEPDLLARFPELAVLEGLDGVPGEGQARVDA